MIIAATGHRPDKLGGYGADVRLRLRTVATEYLALIAVDRVLVGMALGWDMAFAEAAHALRIPYVAAVPFKGQDSQWPAESRWRYRKILDAADRVVIVSEGGYSPEKMQRRNVWMADRAHRMAALWDGSPGGTANCLAYARTKKRPVDNLWSDFKPPAVFNIHNGDAPADAVSCMRDGPYGNPFRIGVHGTRDEVCDLFEAEILPDLDVEPLRGKNLLCCCKPKRCHADSIFRKANAPR